MSGDATPDNASRIDGLGPLPPPMNDYPDHGEQTWREEDMRAYAMKERDRLLNELRRMHAEAGGRHNYYLCAAVELGGCK